LIKINENAFNNYISSFNRFIIFGFSFSLHGSKRQYRFNDHYNVCERYSYSRFIFSSWCFSTTLFSEHRNMNLFGFISGQLRFLCR
jgi:hypothetical protein